MKIDRVVPCADLSVVTLTDAEIEFNSAHTKRLILANNEVIVIACK